jgi:hypothetical protein
MSCLLKTSRDLQMLFAVVTHLAEVLRHYPRGKVSNQLSGLTEANSTQNRTTVKVLPENVNEK